MTTETTKEIVPLGADELTEKIADLEHQIATMRENHTADMIAMNGKGLAPTNAGQLWWIANRLLKSGSLPPSWPENPDGVFMALAFAAEFGMTPTQAMRSVMVVNNRPALYGDVPLGLVSASGLLVSFDEELIGDHPAETLPKNTKDWPNEVGFMVTATRREPERTVCETFTVADARRAGLWNPSKDAKPWNTYPLRMLKYRARSNCLRDLFPDVLMGMHTAEELTGHEEVRGTFKPDRMKVAGEGKDAMSAEEIREKIAERANTEDADVVEADEVKV